MVQPLAIGSATLAGVPATLEPSIPALAQSSAAQVQAPAEASNSNATHNSAYGQTPDQSGNQSLEQAIEQLNSEMQAWSTGMRFEVDDDAQRVVISIIDSATGEVLRTVPSDAVVRIAKMIVQFQGNTVDTRA